jgi:hypothetical protein
MLLGSSCIFVVSWLTLVCWFPSVLRLSPSHLSDHENTVLENPSKRQALSETPEYGNLEKPTCFLHTTGLTLAQRSRKPLRPWPICVYASVTVDEKMM